MEPDSKKMIEVIIDRKINKHLKMAERNCASMVNIAKNVNASDKIISKILVEVFSA